MIFQWKWLILLGMYKCLKVLLSVPWLGEIVTVYKWAKTSNSVVNKKFISKINISDKTLLYSHFQLHHEGLEKLLLYTVGTSSWDVHDKLELLELLTVHFSCDGIFHLQPKRLLATVQIAPWACVSDIWNFDLSWCTIVYYTGLTECCPFQICLYSTGSFLLFFFIDDSLTFTSLLFFFIEDSRYSFHKLSTSASAFHFSDKLFL